MHEFSIATQILETVREFSESHGNTEILRVRLEIGELMCVEAEQLRFCFDSIKQGTALNDAVLEIEFVRAVVKCSECEYEGGPKYWDGALAGVSIATLQCPQCGKVAEAIQGRDCAIKSVQMTEPISSYTMMNATLTPPQQHPSKLNGDTGRLPQGRGDLNQEGKRLQEWIHQIESLPQVEARELLYKCLQSVLSLHHDGLARVLLLVKNAGSTGREINDAFFRDKLVSSLLLIHNLHPVPLEKRLRGALDKVRPYMESHGGNVELLQLENDVARLRLEGTCKSCPSSSVTLELAVRQAVEEACPDLVGFEVEGVVAQSTTTGHSPSEAPKWTAIDDLEHLDDGEMRPRKVAAVPVLFIKAGRLYAYRNICPGCEGTLDDGILEDKILCCRLGHRFDVQRAGLCPDNPEIHLEPFPLLAANGMVKISVR